MSDAFGSAAEEAGRLVDALGKWLASANLGERLPGGSSDCRLCPVCQLIGLLRTARPEVVEHLEDAMASLLSAARVALEAGERSRAGTNAGFEHIDIG